MYICFSIQTRKHGLDLGPVHAGFVVSKVSLGQVFFLCEYLGCPLSISFQLHSMFFLATSRVLRPRPAARMQAAKLYYAARVHSSKLCI